MWGASVDDPSCCLTAACSPCPRGDVFDVHKARANVCNPPTAATFASSCMHALHFSHGLDACAEHRMSQRQLYRPPSQHYVAPSPFIPCYILKSPAVTA